MTLLDALKSKLAGGREAARLKYCRIIARAAKPAAKDADELREVADELGLTVGQIAADIETLPRVTARIAELEAQRVTAQQFESAEKAVTDATGNLDTARRAEAEAATAFRRACRATAKAVEHLGDAQQDREILANRAASITNELKSLRADNGRILGDQP